MPRENEEGLQDIFVVRRIRECLQISLPEKVRGEILRARFLAQRFPRDNRCRCDGAQKLKHPPINWELWRVFVFQDHFQTTSSTTSMQVNRVQNLTLF